MTTDQLRYMTGGYMILRNFCLLIATLMCFTNVAYSQLSVCKLPKGNSRIGLNYLQRVTDQFAEKPDYTYSYNNDYLRLGVDYGIKEDIQISVIPGFKIESGDKQLNLMPSLFEFQAMVNKQIDITNFNYFFVGSVRLQNFQTQDQENEESTEIIVGGGMYYKYEPFYKYYLVGFVDAYYERKDLFNPNEYLHNMGLDMGLEFVLPNKTTLIAKWNPSLAGKYSSINVSLCIKY